MTPQPTPERVRVTSTRTAAARRSDRPLTRDLAEQTGLGEVYLRGLMRAQLRLSIGILATGAVLLGGLPLVFMLAPFSRQATIGGIPLPWFILGIGVYPVAVLVSRFYVRASERIEGQFTELTDAPPPPPARVPRRGSSPRASSPRASSARASRPRRPR